jgi:bifunctional non-homologous end joining protein LigD
MLAVAAETAADLPADGTAWAYEVKWDGVRALAHLRDGRLRLVSRAGNDITAGYPELTPLGRLHPDAVLDGEIVVLRAGRPSFAALAERMHVREPRAVRALAAAAPATYLVFDLLRLDGADTTGLPWTRRRALLEQLAEGADGPGPTSWRVGPVYDDRDALLAATREQHLEGVVAKRREARYRPGARSADWVKLAHRHHQVALVGGWRCQTGSRDRLGALLLGMPDGAGGLAFIGRVGSGITAEVARRLREQFQAAPAPQCPFTTAVPAADVRGTIWTLPRVVVEVRYLGRGAADRLRQPVFRGVRTDLGPDDVRWET